MFLPDGLGARSINTAHCRRRPAYTYCRQVAFNARPSVYLARSAAAGSIEMSASVCLSVCLSASISPKTACPTFTNFCVHVTTYGRGSISICRLSDKLCTSGCLNDVPTMAMSVQLQRRRCSVVRRLTPLLLGVGCVLF